MQPLVPLWMCMVGWEEAYPRAVWIVLQNGPGAPTCPYLEVLQRPFTRVSYLKVPYLFVPQACWVPGVLGASSPLSTSQLTYKSIAMVWRSRIVPLERACIRSRCDRGRSVAGNHQPSPFFAVDLYVLTAAQGARKPECHRRLKMVQCTIDHLARRA